MRLSLTVVFAAGSDRRDLQLTLDDDATIGELAAELRSPSGTVWVGGQPLDTGAVVGRVLREGALVALARESARPPCCRNPPAWSRSGSAADRAPDR